MITKIISVEVTESGSHANRESLHYTIVYQNVTIITSDRIFIFEKHNENSLEYREKSPFPHERE